MKAESAALLALERRIRRQVGAQVEAIADNFGAYLASVVRAAETSGTELLSRDDINAALTAVLAGAELKVEAAVSGGYRAAANLGKVVAARELQPYGHDVTGPLPYLGGYLDSVIADVRSAFGGVLMDIHNAVRDAYDGVTGDNASAYRVLTTNAALKRAVRQLGVRLTAAGTTALHRGYTDAQLAFYTAYTKTAPRGVRLRKKWTVTDADACPQCRALNGVTLPIPDQFDPDAGTPDGHRSLPIYRDLHGPPRHPNCRCRLVLV